jgi:hypothetical protein
LVLVSSGGGLTGLQGRFGGFWWVLVGWWVLADSGVGLTGFTGSDGSGRSLLWILVCSGGSCWILVDSGGFWWILVGF